MEDIFKPLSLSIGELFINKDALYQIPRYQRPYSWGDDQLDKLWEDLREAMQSGEPNYFLGSVITAKPEEKSSYLDVVDGQQRLTTLLIMFCVARDLYPEINHHVLEEDPDAIDNKLLASAIKYNDRFERLRLRTHSNHESDFQELVLKDGNAVKNRKPYKKDLRIEVAPKFKFQNTSNFFREKFEELGEEKSGEFINYLFNNVKIIRIDCQSVSFAIKLFQVLNDRGLDLSNADLIKSFLIGKIHKKYDGDDELKKNQEEQFMDDWKYCETVAQDTYETMNNLFVMYEYFLLAKNPEKSLYDELKKQFEDKDANEVISDFKKFVSTYKDEIYNREDALMYSFYYLRWTMYWKSIVITALHTDYPDYEQFLKVFRRYYYINWIAGNTLTKIKQTSFNLISWLKEKRPLDEIRTELERLLNQDAKKRAIENLDGDIYFEPWCKPLLFILEYKHQDNPKYLWMEDRNIHVEHVLPRGYEKNEDWSYFKNVPHIDSWINTGGNLTLLSGYKNIVASNDKFSEKMKAYDGTGNHSEDDDKVTSFFISQKIVNDYNSSTFNKEWNTDSINKRWEWFCDQVSHEFQLDLSEIKSNIIV